MQCQMGFHSHFYCPGNSTATGTLVDTPSTNVVKLGKATNQPPQ